MFGTELAVGYVFAWAVRKARRAAGAADDVVDQAVDAGVERVHQLVTQRLGGAPALAQVEDEATAESAELSPQARQFLQLALEYEAGRDAAFARALEEAVRAAQAAAPVTASDDGIAVGGNVELHAEGGSVAALRVGNVTLGNPQQPGPQTAP